MRICGHFNKQTKECGLGLSPVECSSCSMFVLSSRRSYQQELVDFSMIGADHSGTVEGGGGVVSGSLKFEANVNEQQILQSSTVKGGCGCSKK